MYLSLFLSLLDAHKCSCIYVTSSPNLLSCPLKSVHEDLEWNCFLHLLFTSGCLFITLRSYNESKNSLRVLSEVFSWVWNPIRFLCMYSEKETERERERWSSWHVLRKAIPSHLNKTHPKRTGEIMGWWHFILKALLVVKVTKLFKCLWIRLRD